MQLYKDMGEIQSMMWQHHLMDNWNSREFQWPAQRYAVTSLLLDTIVGTWNWI